MQDMYSDLAAWGLGGAALYLALGLIFAIPFVFIGAGKVDPLAASGSWGFRLLILPGAALFWPLLARRWWSGATEPPAERTAHKANS
jgi:hypothetical protein